MPSHQDPSSVKQSTPDVAESMRKSRGAAPSAIALLLQRREATNARADSSGQQEVVQRIEQAFGRPRTSTLPAQLQAGTERLSGVSLDDVRVHYNSDKPAQLQALAYAQGSNIYVGPGQESHLSHEAWHVVQQKQGRVPANVQLQGLAANTDSNLEHEADVMGARAERFVGSLRGGQAEGPAYAAGSGVVQGRYAPVIQARLVPVSMERNGRKPLLHANDRYVDKADESGLVRPHLDIDVNDYPHIKKQTLDEYERFVTEKPDAVPKAIDIYEDVAEPYRAFIFSEDQSEDLCSIFLTHGGEIATIFQRQKIQRTHGYNQAKIVLEAGGNATMGEVDLQHIGTHLPGTEGGGTHRHVYKQGGYSLAQLGKAIDVCEEKELFGEPTADARGRLIPEHKRDADKPDSYTFGRRVRAALGVPERDKPKLRPVDATKKVRKSAPPAAPKEPTK